MNSIFTMDAEQGKISFIIPHIVFVKLKDSQVEVVLNCPEPSTIYNLSFPSSLEAAGAHLKILSIIGSYYDAMMLQKADSAQNNADEIRIAHENENRANETVSKLANFISVLCQQTMGDCEIAPMHLDNKMKRLEQWVTNKAKEGK